MIPLQPGGTFHIYTHANGRDNLFSETKNYYYFLEKYKLHIPPIAHTIGYCLMPNHLHLLLQFKNEDQLLQQEAVQDLMNRTKNYPDFRDQLERFLSKQFANLFSSYTQAYNKLYHRRGSLFIKNFKRKEVTSEWYAQKLINYLHFNPVVSGFVTSPDAWLFSSYKAILKQQQTAVHYQQALDWFGGVDNFIYLHQHPMDGSFDY